MLLKIVKHIRWQFIFERWMSLSSCFVEPASYPHYTLLTSYFVLVLRILTLLQLFG